MPKKRRVTNLKIARLYVVDGLTCAQVARQVHMSKAGVWARLKNLKIKRRSRLEWLKLKREREQEYIRDKLLTKYLEEIPEAVFEAGADEEKPKVAPAPQKVIALSGDPCLKPEVEIIGGRKWDVRGGYEDKAR